MKALLLIAALGSLPAFQPEPSMLPRPLLWETPVSWTAEAAPAPPALAEAEAELLRRALEIAESSGPVPAAAALEKAEAPVLILKRAELKRQAGQVQSAQADYEKILASKNRTAPRALALEGYKSILRQRIEAGERALYKELAACLKDEWRNEEALALLPAIWADPRVPDEIKARLAKDEPIMALRLGRYERAAELWAGRRDRSETQWLAQTENRRGNFLKAAELREGLAGRLAGKAKSRELETAWATLAKAGLYDEALALAERHPEIKKLADYNWRLGLAALAAGRPAEARASFEILTAAGGKNNKRLAGARYYLARSLEGEGRAAEAAKHYRQLLAGPFSYYRILAQGRLTAPVAGPDDTAADCLVCLGGQANQRGLELAAPLALLLESGPAGRDQDSLAYYLWLSEKGLEPGKLAEAAAELAALKGGILAGGQSVAALEQRLRALLAVGDWPGLLELMREKPEALRAPAPAARESWPPLAATVAAEGGDYRLAVSLMARIPSPEARGLKRWSHPPVYGREVRRAWREHGLPPALLLALIRTESAYQPDIMSASNARGLMQLLPATANKVAAALGEKEPGPLDLFEPDLNIRYGSWYLAALIRGFGSTELALAGYNGGPYNIKSLLAAKAGMPLDVFVESLPFEETSNYVKRITESRYIYEMVYLGRAALPDLAAPVPQPGSDLPDF